MRSTDLYGTIFFNLSCNIKKTGKNMEPSGPTIDLNFDFFRSTSPPLRSTKFFYFIGSKSTPQVDFWSVIVTEAEL